MIRRMFLFSCSVGFVCTGIDFTGFRSAAGPGKSNLPVLIVHDRSHISRHRAHRHYGHNEHQQDDQGEKHHNKAQIHIATEPFRAAGPDVFRPPDTSILIYSTKGGESTGEF